MMMARAAHVFALFVFASLSIPGFAQFGSGPNTIKVQSLDFAPETGDSYDLKWAGPPRRAWTDADKKSFVLSTKLSEPAPEDISLTFLVKENKTWDLDPVISSVTVNFAKGEATATSRFWLVCTRDGRIQGNLGRDFDGYGNLYAQINALISDPSLDSWRFSASSPQRNQHAVQCR